MKRTQRSGVTIFETTVALAILAVVVSTTVQTLVGVAGVRQANRQQMLAQQQAANLMERLFAMSWAELNDDTAAALQLSEETQQQLRNAKLTVSITDADGELAAKRIHIELSWQNRAGETPKPVELVAWRFQLEDQ